MKITLAQLNPVVGDVRGNLAKVVATLTQEHQHSDLIVFTELFLVGYPPRDLLEKPALLRQVQEALDHLVDVVRPLSRHRHPGGGAPAHRPGHG